MSAEETNTETKPDLSRLPFRLITLMGLVSLVLYHWLPDQMPIHWDRWGHADFFVHKSVGAFLMPLFAALICDGLRLLDRLSPAGMEVARFQDAFDATVACLAAFLTFIHLMMLAVALGCGIAVHRVVPFSIGLLVTAIGCYLPQFKRNWWAGIRTPWSLTSEQAWDETHRQAGPLWVTGGLLLAVTGWFAAALPWLWALVWIGLIGATLYLSWSCRRD